MYTSSNYVIGKAYYRAALNDLRGLKDVYTRLRSRLIWAVTNGGGDELAAHTTVWTFNVSVPVSGGSLNEPHVDFGHRDLLRDRRHRPGGR